MLPCLFAFATRATLALGFAAAAAAAAATCATGAPAPHDPGLSALTVSIRSPAQATARLAFANADFAAGTIFDSNGDGRIDADELLHAQRDLPTWIARNVIFTIGATRLPCGSVRAAIGNEQDVELTLDYEFDAGATANGERAISIPFLGALAHGHRCYARLISGPIDSPSSDDSATDSTLCADALLHARSCRFVLPGIESSLGETPANGSLAGEFFVLGVEHILIGYDHLAFLLALLAVGVTLRRTLLTITAFSLAHSLTLTAAALDWLQLPSTFVEASIAGSIVVVAVANLTQRHREAPHRWPLALAFGLLHGFGFAGVLSEFEVQGGAVFVPLLSFNLGVEAGQVLCAAVAFPLLAAFARRRPVATSVTLSVLAGTIGIYWLLERSL